MDEKYIILRKQLQYLGYIENFPVESMELVESLTNDLVQTTRSLQHYMKLAKEAIQQRDTWKCAAEPYKCDNANLIRDNNKLNLNLLHCKEELMKSKKDFKVMEREKDDEIENLSEKLEKLQRQLVDQQLKSIRAETISSSRKSVTNLIDSANVTKKDLKTKYQGSNVCIACESLISEINEKIQEISTLKNENLIFTDKLMFLNMQVERRDKEIERLNTMLEGGRPLQVLQKECFHDGGVDEKLADLTSKLMEIETANIELSKKLHEAISKQHEAMSRAVQLAEKNKLLEKHLHTTDEMALKTESVCNTRLKETHALINSLETELQASKLELDEYKIKLQNLMERHMECTGKIEEKCNEITALKIALNESKRTVKKLQEDNESLSPAKEIEELKLADSLHSQETCTCSNKVAREELLKLLESERKYYENQLSDIKFKLEDKNRIEQQTKAGGYENMKSERDFYFNEYQALKQKAPREEYVAELQCKICELEQQIFRLEKENTSMNEKLNVLRRKLDNAVYERQSQRSENESRSAWMVENLERDLFGASREISKLEKENDLLSDKLRSLSNVENTYRHEKKMAEEASSIISKLQEQCKILRDNLQISESELLHTKTLYNQLKALQTESDKNVSDIRDQLFETRKEINVLKSTLALTEKHKNELEYENKHLKSDKNSMKNNLNQIDRERDKLVVDIDDKTEKISSLEHQLRSKNTTIELLENKINEFNKKLELLVNENVTLDHKLRDNQTCNEALSLELDTITKQRDNAVIENKRLQSDLATLKNDLRTVKREYEHSRKEVEEMKQQLQHYVDEVRRIEDILSRKEAERTEMLDQFACLSHEATALENSNNSLENESATKSVQLQVINNKMSELEKKLHSREALVDMQEEKISSYMHRISALEVELTRQKDINKSIEQQLVHARDMCTVLENQKKTILIGVGEVDTDKQGLEYDLKLLKNEKSHLEELYAKEKASIKSLETMLADSKQEIMELKLTLQTISDDNRKLRKKVECFQKYVSMIENDSTNSRRRASEAAKHLQDLQFQMSEERYQRVSGDQSDQKHKTYSSGTL